MRSPRLACCIATWQDGQLLETAVRSVRPYVDVVLIYDGGYSGFVSEEHRWSPSSDLLAARAAGAVLYPATWRGDASATNGQAFELLDPPLEALASEPAKRNALLELARRHIGAGWVLFLDADELLRNGELLRDDLASLPDEILAYGIPRLEEDGRVWAVPTHCLRLMGDTAVDPVVSWRVVSAGQELELPSAEIAPEPTAMLLARRPWVLHRPELRPPWRREWRAAWHARLRARESGA